MAEPLLDAPAVAELIGMRVDFVYKLVRRGDIPHIRWGRTVRFRGEAIETWLRESERSNKTHRNYG